MVRPLDTLADFISIYRSNQTPAAGLKLHAVALVADTGPDSTHLALHAYGFGMLRHQTVRSASQ